MTREEFERFSRMLMGSEATYAEIPDGEGGCYRVLCLPPEGTTKEGIEDLIDEAVAIKREVES